MVGAAGTIDTTDMVRTAETAAEEGEEGAITEEGAATTSSSISTLASSVAERSPRGRTLVASSLPCC